MHLHALGVTLYFRGEIAEARTLAGRCETLATSTGDRVTLLCACLVHGLVERHCGRPRAARDWLEKGLAAVEGLDAAPVRRTRELPDKN